MDFVNKNAFCLHWCNIHVLPTCPLHYVIIVVSEVVSILLSSKENSSTFVTCLSCCFFLLQLESLRGRLDEREGLLKQKEKKLISVSSEHSENSYAVENLQSILSTKERQITSLKQKVANSFDSYKIMWIWKVCCHWDCFCCHHQMYMYMFSLSSLSR